jgi:opacity protein-like surface antigen
MAPVFHIDRGEVLKMRVMFGVALSLVLVARTVSGQSLMIQGAAGPTVNDAGHSLSAGIGFSPTSHLTVLIDVEQAHLSSRFTSDGRGGGSAFRGGTFTLAAAELRASLRPHRRVSPYVLAGVGAGVSRPNVNHVFTDRITNRATAVFFGGGIDVPLQERFSVFADARIILGAEVDVLIAIAPIRGGVAFRF